MKNFLSRLSFKQKFLFLLIVYFLLLLIVRIVISGSVEFDEAEQVLFSQQLSLGYGSQPPLYEWIQKIFFTIFGLNIFSLALFKNSLFVLTYFFLYLSARIILQDNLRAALASLALLLTHTYGWQSMHQLTHAILALSLCSITFFIFLKLKDTPVTKYYLALSFVVGLGILAKYNYSFFILALFLAAASTKEFRKVILDKRMFLVLVVPLIITAPHFIWVTSNFKQATLRLTEMQADANKAKGLLDFLLCLLALLGQLVVVFAIFFPKAFTRNRKLKANDGQFKQLLERFFIFAVIVNGLWVVVFKIVDFEERWLQLIFFILPTYLFLRLKQKNVSQRRIRAYAYAIGFSAVILVVMLVACALFPDVFGYKRLHYPIEELSAEIRKQGFDKGLVLSPDTSVAADIKLQFKDSLVLTHKTYFTAPKRFDKILLIWGDTWWYDVPRELSEILPQQAIEVQRTDIVKKALYKYSKDKYYKVYLKVIDRNK